MKALTYNQYRIINIVILSIVFTVIEFAVTLGANIWFPELPYTLSLAIIFMSLEMMRWRGFGIVAVLVSGLSFCAASAASADQYLIYCVGNLLALGALLYLKLMGSEKVRKSGTYTVIYVLLIFVLAQLGRWIVSTLMGNDPMLIVQFFTTDALSGLFGIIVVYILRNTDGLFEDQKKYLLRLDEERRAREAEQD